MRSAKQSQPRTAAVERSGNGTTSALPASSASVPTPAASSASRPLSRRKRWIVTQVVEKASQV